MASMVPVLQDLNQDNTPAVVRRAVTTGSILFRSTFEQVAMQGIYSGHVEKSLQDAWNSSVSLKDAMYATCKEHGNGGVRLLAIKFLETAILLFTPDPSKPALPPPEQNWDWYAFNISWIVGGHPILDAERLGQEADEYLTYLLEQLSDQVFCKLPGPLAIVVVNSLASIAKRRPAMYGLIIPALSRLSSICEGIRGPQRASIIHAVKNGLVSLLRCTHSGAGIWREHLTTALRAMNAGDLAEAAIRQTDRMLRNAERERAFGDARLSKEEMLQAVDYKRPLLENGSVSAGDGNVHSAKRLRASSETPYACLQDNQVSSDGQDAIPSRESSVLSFDSNLTPLQQMITMIGALVAQGERATASIEILITSLPADMLADVVIENMKNLPPSAPAVNSSANVSGSSDTQNIAAGSQKLASAPLTLAATGVPAVSPPEHAGSDHKRDPRRDPRRMDPRRVAVPVGVSQSSVVSIKIEEPAADSPRGLGTLDATFTQNGLASPLPLQESIVENITVLTTSQPVSSPPRIIDLSLGQEIDSSGSGDAVVESKSMVVSQPESATAPGSTLLVSELSSILSPRDTDDQSFAAEPMDTAEAVPTKSVVPGPLELVSADQILHEGTSALPGTTIPGLPLAVPIPSLDENQQAALWKVLLLRILERYVVSGSTGRIGSRFGLLCRLISQSISDDDAVIILQNFILADYISHKGHELAMHMLYQLCTEKIFGEEDGVGSEIYEKFLIAVAQGLREALPPGDKSLSRLLSEAPVIPSRTLKWLESVCNPSEDVPINGDRIFQGLSAVWFLILIRPPIRKDCLEIALKCAVHQLDEVRTKAIRLVANKLYPLPYASQRIEEFTISMLHNVVGREGIEDKVRNIGGHETWPLKQFMEQEMNIEDVSSPKGSEKQGTNRNTIEGDQYRGGKSHVSVGEAQRCMSLYFALCTKKVLLLQQLFDLYEHAPKAVRQTAHRNMPVLIRTIGSTSLDLLQLLSDPPLGSKNLLLLVLHLLTDADAPSSELIAIVKKLYQYKLKDARLLIPVLSSLTKAEVLPIFPHLVALPSEDFKAALDRILQGSVHTGPALTPAEVLVAIHAIDPERDHIPLAMVKEACAVCFEQRTVFTQQVLAKVLKQLVEQTPIPMLFMRTVILAVGSFRSLVSFVMEILSRLVSKQIWKWPNLWIGFLKCADQTQPHSFPVLLQLPAIQLDRALHKHPNLRAPLTAYANKPNVLSGLPKPTVVVLGLLQDGLPSDAASYGQQAVPSVASSNVVEKQIRESAAML